MPRPHERTRSKKRSNTTAPSGRGKTPYKAKTGNPARCGACGRPLAGIVCSSPLKAGKLTGSGKRVWRPYGGQLCHACLKTALRQTARKT